LGCAVAQPNKAENGQGIVNYDYDLAYKFFAKSSAT
jgi:hypothetical protein